MLNYQAKHQTQVGLKFLREVLSKLVWVFSAFKNVIKVLKVRGGTFAGLKIKRWDFRRSYKSLKTAVVLRPDWQNFFTVVVYFYVAVIVHSFVELYTS